jgi:hypothetical protein
MGQKLINQMNAKRNRYSILKMKIFGICFPQKGKSIFDIISESKGDSYFYSLERHFASNAPIPNFA